MIFSSFCYRLNYEVVSWKFISSVWSRLQYPGSHFLNKNAREEWIIFIVLSNIQWLLQFSLICFDNIGEEIIAYPIRSMWVFEVNWMEWNSLNPPLTELTKLRQLYSITAPKIFFIFRLSTMESTSWRI